jgi:lysophospholipase L1-like esterase
LISALIANLASAVGATVTGFLHTIAGAVQRTVSSKLLETVSIQDVGGSDDWNGSGGTNNFAAFELLCAKAPITIRLPRTNTGVYMLSGTTALMTTAGVVLDIDEGVRIHIKAGRTAVNVPGLKTTRYLNIYHEDLRYSTPLGPRMYEKPSEKSSFMSANAGELHKPISLDFTLDSYSAKLSAWPNGNLVRYAPSAVAAASVTHAAPGSVFAGTLVSVVPGDQIHAELTASAFYPGVMLKTDTGWMVVWHEIGTNALKSMELVAGAGAGKTYQQSLLLNASYSLENAMVGLSVHDEKSFSLLVNGIAIKRLNTVGNIQAAGWSGGFGPGSFTIANPVLFRNKRTSGVKPLKVVTIGDSISETTTTLRSHFELAMQYLTGMGGFQLDTLTNLAVAGHTSSNQVTVLGATPIAGYDYCLIQIGVNDIQSEAALTTLTTNIETMVAYCRDNYVTPIVGLPTMWYSRAAAQAFGQDGALTDNNNATIGKGYRLTLLRKLSDLGVYANMGVLEDEGAVIASLLGLAGADQLLVDNIHPTVYGSMLMGYSWAKALAAHITAAPVDIVPATFMETAWFTNAPGTVPSYTARDGVFTTMGYLSIDAATWVNGSVVATLPKRLRPPAPVNQVVQCFNSSVAPLAGPALIQIGVDGTIRVYLLVTGTAFISFSGNWRI